MSHQSLSHRERPLPLKWEITLALIAKVLLLYVIWALWFDQPVPKEELYELRPRWQKFLVMLGGPFMNIVLALAIPFGLALAYGVPSNSAPIVGFVKPGGAADVAGIKAGDRIAILSLNRHELVATLLGAMEGAGRWIEGSFGGCSVPLRRSRWCHSAWACCCATTSTSGPRSAATPRRAPSCRSTPRPRA